MHEHNKQHLIEQMLALIRARPTEPAAGQSDLRLRIGEAIDAAAAHAQEVESRCVTILLSDLRGFTAVAEQFTPREMIEALNRYFRRMSEIIFRHGGTIDKFMGDAIMALFGATSVRDDHVEAALACAIEMQMAMGGINEENQAHGMAPLFMGIGINTGEVVVGHLGSELYREYTVIGDQVNLASRVAAHSLRGQMLLSENTYLPARDFIETGDVNQVKVKGKKGFVRMYELRATTRPRALAAPQREMRNSPRVEVDLPLTFQLVRGKSVVEQEYLGRVTDVSYGGLRLVGPVPVEPFGDIKITVSLSLLSSELSEIYAKVMHVSPIEDNHECRVEFTSIDVKASMTIKEFVDGIVELNRL